MADWIDITNDPRHVAREKRNAKALRRSQWWRQRLAKGICAYCHGTFAPDELTMDHVVPLARGGRSIKGGIVNLTMISAKRSGRVGRRAHVKAIL